MPAARTTIIGLVSALVLCGNAALAQSTLQFQANADTRALLRDAESRLARNDADSAYDLLSPREAELAGNAYYDYLLGVSALDSGRTSVAIFSLQRALAVEPRFSGARMELARAYFEAGNNDQARPLFATLLNEGPPPGVRDVLLSYINAIDARPPPRRSRFSKYVDVTAGHDTNANGATPNQQFLGFTLSPDNVETESDFGEIGAGFNWTIPSGNSATWYLGGRASHRHNKDASFVDAGIFSAMTGYSWRSGSTFGRFGADGYVGLRDGEHNEWYAGYDLLLGRTLNDRFDAFVTARSGAHRYDASIDVLDVNRFLYTVGATLRMTSLSSLTLEAVGGSDDARQPGSAYGNDKSGGRLSLAAVFGNATLSASVGSLTTEYDGLFFGSLREDDQVTSILQLEFRDVITDGLSIIPRLRYVDNDSNVDLYRYDRTEFGLMFRWMPR